MGLDIFYFAEVITTKTKEYLYAGSGSGPL